MCIAMAIPSSEGNWGLGGFRPKFPRELALAWPENLDEEMKELLSYRTPAEHWMRGWYAACDQILAELKRVSNEANQRACENAKTNVRIKEGNA
jgi:hypothetical protein